VRTCFILAGGFGTRIRHILGDIPKPLAPVNGRPFLFWLSKNLYKNGFRKIIFLAHFEPEKIIRFADSLDFPELSTEVVVERQPMGTAGSIVSALSELSNIEDEFLIVNGDSLVITNLSDLFLEMSASNKFSLLGISMENCSRYGALKLEENGKLLSFREKTGSMSGTINSGVYFAKKKFFEKKGPFMQPYSLEYDFIPRLLAAGEWVNVISKDNVPFIDIGTESSLAEADDFIKKYVI